MVRIFIGSVILLLLPLLASAETFNADLLSKRVQERWNTMAEREFGKTYLFETPAYKRVFPVKMYLHQFALGVEWRFKDITNISFDSDTGVASVTVSIETSSAFDSGMGIAKENTVVPVIFDEKWLHIGDQWWHSSTK